jgi:AIG1 family
MVNNILIIGITGNGKSALANLLANTDKFGESSSSTSATKDFQKSDVFKWEFELENKELCVKEYQVIDNIGFGDTDNTISEESILLKIGEGIYSAKEGINQVLFVFDGRFSDEQIAAFNLFKNFVSESKITNYATIVRTRFPNFREEIEWKEDKANLLKQRKEVVDIINLCKGGMIYIDNPPIPKIKESGNDGGSKESVKEKKMREIKEREAKRNKEKKECSREIVLNHLAKNCRDIYKLEELGNVSNINSIVKNYIEKKEEIEKNNSLSEDKRKELQKDLESKAAKSIKESLNKKLSTELEKASTVMEYYIQSR